MASTFQLRKTYSPAINKSQDQQKIPVTITSINRKKQFNPLEPLKKFTCRICCLDKDLYKFADCNHKLACNQCLQEWVKQSLHKKEIPSCYFQHCTAQMITIQGSAFSHFSSKTQDKYSLTKNLIQTVKNNELSDNKNVIRPCRIVDCEGYINLQTLKCCVCSAQHCQHCFRAHSKESNCRQALNLSTRYQDPNLILCPFCSTGFDLQVGGCNKLQCKACKNLFCICCKQKWSLKHHMCKSNQIPTLPFYQIPFLWLKQCIQSKNVQNEQNNEISSTILARHQIRTSKNRN